MGDFRTENKSGGAGSGQGTMDKGQCGEIHHRVTEAQRKRGGKSLGRAAATSLPVKLVEGLRVRVMWVERGTDLTGENFVRGLGSVVETRRRTRRSVKTRIHNLEHRIQPTKRSLNAICGVRRERQRCDPEARRGGKRWVGRRVYVGKGGQEVAERIGFSRLFPHDSTQVVDFPYICVVRVFGEEHEMVTMGGSDCAWRVYFPGCSPKVVDVKMFGSRSRKGYWYVLCVLDRAEIWD